MNATTSKDGTTIAYDVYGSGSALLFITGATCFRSFEPVLHTAFVFAEQFRVYNYDRRGRGDSGNTLPYTGEREVEDIEALIDAAGGSAFLYGHSSGAILALEAAMRLGDKVRKLVMYDPSYAPDEASQRALKELYQGVSALLEHGKHDEAIRLFWEGIGLPQEAIAGMQHSRAWATMRALAPTLAYDMRLASDLPPIAHASQLTTPTQIMVGAESPTSIHKTANQLREAIPNARYTRLAGQDHLPNPEVVLPVLLSFLTQ